MSKASFIRRGMGMFPVDDDGEELIRAVKDGAECMGEFRPARHPKQHRLFFALLKLLVDNAEQFETIDQALVAIKVATHEVDEVIDAATGQVFYTLRSIAFESMPQDRFNRFFNRALFVITERWLIGTGVEELRREAYRLIDGLAAIGERVDARAA